MELYSVQSTISITMHRKEVKSISRALIMKLTSLFHIQSKPQDAGSLIVAINSEKLNVNDKYCTEQSTYKL